MTTTGTADERPLFGPESRFSGFFDDPRWALAIIRATVLEAAHPQIGAALVDNSTFVAHPWRRLRNTFLSMRRMFGADPAVREREAARLNRLHARMSGSDSRGRAYDAMDRATRAWVVATLFESAVTMCLGSAGSRSTRTPWSGCTPSTDRSSPPSTATPRNSPRTWTTSGGTSTGWSRTNWRTPRRPASSSTGSSTICLPRRCWTVHRRCGRLAGPSSVRCWARSPSPRSPSRTGAGRVCRRCPVPSLSCRAPTAPPDSPVSCPRAGSTPKASSRPSPSRPTATIPGHGPWPPWPPA